MLATPVLRLQLDLRRCSFLWHLVLVFLAIILSEQENLKFQVQKKRKKKEKKVNIEHWFEILVE